MSPTKPHKSPDILEAQLHRVLTIKCCVCGQTAYRIDWAPPNGLHPQLKAFQCTCQAITYAVREGAKVV